MSDHSDEKFVGVQVALDFALQGSRVIVFSADHAKLIDADLGREYTIEEGQKLLDRARWPKPKSPRAHS